jgi:hypothetical protein
MKRVLSAIAAFVAFFAATTYAQTAPGGVCVNNVALTISNGYNAPVPYALITLCSAGSTASNCAANIQQTYADTTLTTLSPTTPLTAFQSDVGGNYFFCAHVGHYALLVSGSQGTYFVNDIALVDDWSRGGVVTGSWSVTGLFITTYATPTPLCLQIGSGGQVSPTTYPCGNSNAVGTVTNVAIGPGWPAWLTPNISNPGTTPSINMTVTAIPNSALANAFTTVNGQTCTLGASCTIVIHPNVVQTTPSRSFGVTYQNTGTGALYVSGYGLTHGSSTGQISCLDGPSSPSTTVWSNENTASVEGAVTGFSCLIPASYYYEVAVSGDVYGVGGWAESAF